MVSATGDILRDEVEVLHQQIFYSAPSDSLIDEYVRAHLVIRDLVLADREQVATLRLIVHKGLDAVGIEPWFRTGQSRHLLSSKLLLISYLAECDGRHSTFKRISSGRLRGLFSMGLACVFGVYRLIRGGFQKFVYGLR